MNEFPNKIPRVICDEKAIHLIEELATQHGPLMFHQSGGCCDGSQPMCFREGEFLLGPSDVKLGSVGGFGFYMSADQFEYWQHTQLELTTTPGRGSSFSLEIPLGLRFIIKSRIFTPQEMMNLEPALRME
jgi:uncharacterized protein